MPIVEEKKNKFVLDIKCAAKRLAIDMAMMKNTNFLM